MGHDEASVVTSTGPWEKLSILVDLDLEKLVSRKMASTIFMNNPSDFAGHNRSYFGMKVRR